MIVQEHRNSGHEFRSQILKQRLVDVTRLHADITSLRIRRLLKHRIRELQAEVAFTGR